MNKFPEIREQGEKPKASIGTWVRRALILAVLAPGSGAVALGCCGGLANKVIEGAPLAASDLTSLPQKEVKDVADWYYKSENLEVRNIRIVKAFLKDIDTILGEPEDFDVWKEFKFEVDGVEFHGRYLIHTEKNVGAMPVEILGPDGQIIFRHIFQTQLKKDPTEEYGI